MADRHTLEELNNCSREELITIVLMMQGQLDTLNENIERLIEQVRIANSYRFGKHTETLDSIDGQMSFFDEAESCCDLSVPEPAAEEVLPPQQVPGQTDRSSFLPHQRRTSDHLWNPAFLCVFRNDSCSLCVPVRSAARCSHSGYPAVPAS